MTTTMTPGRGHTMPDCGTPATTRLRTRSIPNVPTGRIVRAMTALHDAFHTVDGLHAFDGPRRAMIDNGFKIVAMRAELTARGVPVPAADCRFCVGVAG